MGAASHEDDQCRADEEVALQPAVGAEPAADLAGEGVRGGGECRRRDQRAESTEHRCGHENGCAEEIYHPDMWYFRYQDRRCNALDGHDSARNPGADCQGFASSDGRIGVVPRAFRRLGKAPAGRSDWHRRSALPARRREGPVLVDLCA